MATGFIADQGTYLAGISALLRKEWPNNRIVNIVTHGHSVPAGYFATPTVDSLHAYPHLLHKGLKERFPYAVINVIVTAIGGENSHTGAARFADDVLSHHPDLITIDYALNDRQIGIENAKAAWELMLEQAGAAGVKVILFTPTPDMNAKWDQPTDPLNQHAELIRNLAAEHHVGLVDSLAEFRTYVNGGGELRDLMAQSNHPNANGHALVAKRLLEWFPM